MNELRNHWTIVAILSCMRKPESAFPHDQRKEAA